jgi:BASS family bile acid:Na+ symporter
MSLAQMIALLLRACIIACVFALGLNATWEDITYLWRRPAQLSRSLLAMYVITPLIAVLLVQVFDASLGVKIAVILMAISAGAPILSKKLLKLGGHPPYVYSLAVTAALVAIVTVPISLAVLEMSFAKAARVSPDQVAYVITIAFLAPLFAGMIFRYLWPAPAKRIENPLSDTASIVLSIVAVLILVTTFSTVMKAGLPAFLFIIAITLAELAVGHFLGGPDPGDRTTLALACATRFPALSMLIASLNFPNAKPLPIVVTYLLVSNLVAFPYVRWRKSPHGARAHNLTPLSTTRY